MNQTEPAPISTANMNSPTTLRWFGTAAIASIGIIAGGYLLGDGLLRAKEAERSVTVRGLAERDVTADLATWTISYSAAATDLASAQAKVRQDTAAIKGFFDDLGFDSSLALPVLGIDIDDEHERARADVDRLADELDRADLRDLLDQQRTVAALEDGAALPRKIGVRDKVVFTNDQSADDALR